MSYEPYCAICEQPVNLEESKTDEHGHAVHENCYVWTVELRVFPFEVTPHHKVVTIHIG